ncbi:hypothetical protein K4H00_21360, partial [Mycobacterium tuberculosis]|nr:hypothetical protein [Mycobacterium tuberculosis]
RHHIRRQASTDLRAHRDRVESRALSGRDVCGQASTRWGVDADGDRTADTTEALKQVQAALARLPQFEVRTVETNRASETDDATATRLFQAMNGAFRDVPPSR